MKKFVSQIKFLLAFAAFAFLTGCSSVYQPAALHAPGLEKKNDITVSGSIGSSGGDVSAAFSPAKNIGVFAQYNSFVGSYEENGEEFVRERDVFQGGLGYYKMISPELRFESYLTYGWGEAVNQISSSRSRDFVNTQTQDFFLKGRFHTFSLLSGLAKHDGDILTLSFFTRLVYGNFARHNAHVRDKASGLMYPYDNEPGLFNARRFFTIDPLLQAEMKFNYFHFFMQGGYSMRFSEMAGNYPSVILNFGINLNLNVSRKSTKAKQMYE